MTLPPKTLSQCWLNDYQLRLKLDKHCLTDYQFACRYRPRADIKRGVIGPILARGNKPASRPESPSKPLAKSNSKLVSHPWSSYPCLNAQAQLKRCSSSCSANTVEQSQTAGAAYLKRKQLLLFAFAFLFRSDWGLLSVLWRAKPHLQARIDTANTKSDPTAPIPFTVCFMSNNR